MERLDAAAQRLRIVHRRGNEFVDVDVLDVECLADMRAARPEHLHHLLLVPQRVELRLHGPRLGGHLAEGEGGGKNLDQDRIHEKPERKRGRRFKVRPPR